MNKLASCLLSIIACAALAACSKQESAPKPQTQAPATTSADATSPATAPPSTEVAAETAAEATPAPPAETISETEDVQEAPAANPQAPTVQPALRLGAAAATSPTSAQFKEGTNYQRIVPAQPTTAAPGKVEVAEVFWYGCGHCFALDPAIESWRGKGKPGYVEFVRVPAMWNDATRMHARVFYTAEALGKLDALHSLIFREIHVNGNQLDTLDKISAFFQQHGVSKDELTKTFSSFAVESKLQKADFLNRRYRVQSVPMVVVNGKYTTDVSGAGGEPQLFTLINELAAHEHGG
jgi:protein dithiol oxidoreductase (disulfide-forming)